jgi:hypothetical protein
VFTSTAWPQGRTTIDAIVDPYKFNPLEKVGGRNTGVRYLILDDVNTGSVLDDVYNGPTAWKTAAGADQPLLANSIIEWNGSAWSTIFNPTVLIEDLVYVQNEKTGIQYVWNGTEWLKSFEGEYTAGYWSFELNL